MTRSGGKNCNIGVLFRNLGSALGGGRIRRLRGRGGGAEACILGSCQSWFHTRVLTLYGKVNITWEEWAASPCPRKVIPEK